MRIAQICPLYESVPPKLYGGTERVVSYLTEELVAAGHQVTLFASGDSTTRARLEAPIDYALRLATRIHDPLVYHNLLFERVLKQSENFDILHFHTDYLHFPLMRLSGLPHVTTLHGRLDLPDLVPMYREFREMPLVSISNAQRQPLSWANWRATVHHGLPENLYQLHAEPGKYLAFIGRISPEKRADRAIEIAKRVGMKLRIAAKVEKIDEAYFKQEIEPLLDHPLIEFIGEIGEHDKNDFLGNAYALLFPVDWPEPFGLVIIEALACGTPVVAFRRGSVPELVDEGVTGFIADNTEDAVAAVARIASLDRTRCRRVFEQRFTARRMASDYVGVYQQLTCAGAEQLIMA